MFKIPLFGLSSVFYTSCTKKEPYLFIGKTHKFKNCLNLMTLRTDIDIHYDRYMSRKASKTQIANELGISRNTLTRLFNEYKKTLSGGD